MRLLFRAERAVGMPPARTPPFAHALGSCPIAESMLPYPCESFAQSQTYEALPHLLPEILRN